MAEPSSSGAYRQRAEAERAAEAHKAHIRALTDANREARTVESIRFARRLGMSVARDSAKIDYVYPDWQKTKIPTEVVIPDNRSFQRWRKPRDEMLYTRTVWKDTLALLLGRGVMKAFRHEKGYANFTSDPDRILLLESGLIIGDLSTNTVGEATMWLQGYRKGLDNYMGITTDLSQLPDDPTVLPGSPEDHPE